MSKLLKLNAVIDITGLSRTSIYKQIHAGTFPAQIRIGVRAVAWLESDVECWIRDRVEQGSMRDSVDLKTRSIDEIQ